MWETLCINVINIIEVVEVEDIFFYCFIIIGKTLIAKAVANQTSATFLRVVGSELIQKYLVSDKPMEPLEWTWFGGK